MFVILNVGSLLHHFIATARFSQVPAGLPCAPTGNPDRPVETRRSAARAKQSWCSRFGASRITVGRAVRDLQREGMVERRAGSGTFVTATARRRALSFGLLIPDLGETEIFEPICQGMMASPLARRACARVGQRTRREIEGRARLGSVQAVHRSQSVRGLLRSARAHRRPGCSEPGGSRRRWTMRASRSCCWIAPCCRIRSAVTMI